MTNYEITLPKQVHAPKLYAEYAWFSYRTPYESWLMFDENKDKKLDANELLDAYKYFEQKEKEVSVAGQKGDGIIDNKDVEYLINNDDKFKDLRNDKDFTKDEYRVNFLCEIIKTLAALVSVNLVERASIYEISTTEFDIIKEPITKGPNVFGTVNSDQLVKNVESEEKTINGKDVRICTNEKYEKYVIMPSGDRCVDPDEVAKYLGYKTKSTWLGLGKNKYYTEDIEYGVRNYYQYVTEHLWDEEKHSFKTGETKMYSSFTFLQRFIGLSVSTDDTKELTKFIRRDK